jgi:hypothetical protein
MGSKISLAEKAATDIMETMHAHDDGYFHLEFLKLPKIPIVDKPVVFTPRWVNLAAINCAKVHESSVVVKFAHIALD